MKLFRHLSLAVLLMAASSHTATAQNIQVPQAYMFGFVASFNDSTVYFTNIQQVDSVWITKKKGFIAGRSNYSYQLRDFFTQQRNLPNRTCIVVGSVERKKVEKKYTKLKQQYLSGKNKNKFDVRYLPESEFKFQAVNMGE